MVVDMDREILFRQIAAVMYFQYISNCNIILINTVKEIREVFNQRQYEGGKQVQRALDMVGYLSDKDFKNTVHAGIIPNFPVTLEDIKILTHSFDPTSPH